MRILHLDAGREMRGGQWQALRRHKGAHFAEELAQRTGVNIKLVSRLEDDLAGAALLVYISESEGLGSGALLAMSASVPVIASRVSGLLEVIRHGENGMLVE